MMTFCLSRRKDFFSFRSQFFSTPIRQIIIIIIIIIIITDFEQLAKEEENLFFLFTELAFPRFCQATSS